MRKKYNYIIISILLAFILSVAGFFLASGEKGARVLLTDEEKIWLDKHKNSIKIGVDPVFMPVSGIEDGKITGMMADYFERIEKILGIRFKTVLVSDFDTMLNMTRQNKIDIAGGIAKTPDRSEYLLFSQPVIKYPAVMITRKDLSASLSLANMKHMKICAGKGYAVWGYLKREYPDYDLYAVSDDLAGVKGVEKGIYDVAITDFFSVSYYLKKKEFASIKAAGNVGFTYALAFGTVKSEPILNSILIKALDQISEKEREDIFNKWIQLGYSSNYMTSRTFYAGLAFIAAILVLSFCAYMWNRTLARKISEKATELIERKEHLNAEIALRTDGLVRINTELKKALSEIKTLEGFIPICSSCKKIRKDQQFWESVEEYVARHSELMFQASICPKCEEEILRSVGSEQVEDEPL